MAALQRGPPDGREGAAWAASSLAVDPANVGAFVQANAVPSLLQMLKTGAHNPVSEPSSLLADLWLEIDVEMCGDGSTYRSI